MFGRIRTIIVSGAALLTLIPAASLISGLVGMPPDFNRFLTFTVGVTGPVVLFVAFALRRRLGRLSPPLLISLIATTMIAGLILAWAAYSFAVRHIEPVPYATANGDIHIVRYFKPGSPSGELERLLGEHSGLWRHAIVDVDDGPRIQELMTEQSLPDQRTLILLLNAAQSLLIMSFLAAVFMVADRSRHKRAPEVHPNQPEVQK